MSTPAENTNFTPAAAAPVGTDELRVHVIDALRKVYDPEIPVNIYDLGLIYGIDIDALGAVHLRMTLTSPGCPVAQTFPATVEGAVRAVAGVTGASVELVWEPPWGPDRMTEAAKLQLGML
ncbi:MAG: SUF system Fe-S cluster assembly protein [Gammaproteobacteria bacterium]|nr:SUF system Fe-S cluster assembly protein [Gammaproteobacteria bacterium]